MLVEFDSVAGLGGVVFWFAGGCWARSGFERGGVCGIRRGWGNQTHVSAIFWLFASSRRLMASFTIRGRKSNRFVFSKCCCFTLLLMQPQQPLSIPFPRAEPRFTIQRPGKPALWRPKRRAVSGGEKGSEVSRCAAGSSGAEQFGVLKAKRGVGLEVTKGWWLVLGGRRRRGRRRFDLRCSCRTESR